MKCSTQTDIQLTIFFQNFFVMCKVLEMIQVDTKNYNRDVKGGPYTSIPILLINLISYLMLAHKDW